MYLSTVIVLSSIFSVLAAPIPTRRLSYRAEDPEGGNGTSTGTGNTSPSGGGWPTSTDADTEKAAFGVTGGFKGSYLQEVDNQPMLVGNYPKGSYAGSKPPGPGIAGFIFEADGKAGIDNAKVAVLKYQVKFEEGFDFVLAGKLPGLYGGDDDQVAKTCAGGNHDDRCWSARLMWREEGKGELYGYLPTPNEKLAICKGKCDVKYGASMGTGNWTFTPGEWAQVEEKVTLNDVGKANGEIQILIGNEKKVDVKGLTLRTSEQGRIRGAMIHTFFGGSSKPDYASTKDQKAYFKDFSVEVPEKLES